MTTAKKPSQESTEPTSQADEMCPYWHQVAADFASMYPAGGFCIAGCHKKVKIMADKTVQEVCAMKYGECEGYQRVLSEEATKAKQQPDSVRR